MIKILKAMGFLTSDGVPTARYNEYRGPEPGATLAMGLREAYASLFLSDERVYEKSTQEILDIVKNVSGAGQAVAKKIATTFKALSSMANWNGSSTPPEAEIPEPIAELSEERIQTNSSPAGAPGSFSLHHDIHIHLPPTSDVSVYRAIFQAMKSELL